ncbi:MAG: LysR family transcriptional regulator [Terracidiphilus sp.]
MEAGIEIDFRMVDSRLALERNLQAEEFNAMSDLVEFRHLKYIVAVAEAATITRAAERLFLAQPSLSKQVKDFEDELGFPIFIRTRQGVRITPPGQMIVAYAQEALLKRTKIIAMARAVHRGEVPPFRLGFSSFINPDLLQLFRNAYAGLLPDCLIHLSGGDPLHLLHRLEERTLDGALLPMPIDGREWVMQQVARDPLVVCMQKEDPLARDAQISLSDLAERLTVFRDPAVHPSAHNRLMEMLTEVGIVPEVSCSANTPADIQWMVRAGYVKPNTRDQPADSAGVYRMTWHTRRRCPLQTLQSQRISHGDRCQTGGGLYVRVILVWVGLTEWKRDERFPTIIEGKFRARVDQLVGSRWLAI